MDDFQKYKEFADQGATPNDISLAAKADGGHFIERIKLVRQIFGLSLKEAKEVTIVADGLGTSLDDYQAKLIPGLKLAFYIEEQEEKGKLYAEIWWNGVIVGVGLFDDFTLPVSGEWIPFGTNDTGLFLDAINTDGKAEVELKNGKTRLGKGLVCSNPSAGQIDIIAS